MATAQLRHEWYDVAETVTVSVFVKGVDPDQVTLNLQERSLSLSAKLPTGSDCVFDLDPLLHPIDVSGSSHRVVKGIKVEIKLKKKDVGIKWTKLEGEDAGVSHTLAQTPAEDGAPRAYPSSAKRKTDWNALGKSAELEEEETKKAVAKDPNGGGDKALNEMFQKLYEGASEEQRRAMIKSYTESNGTSLSTDWGSVAASRQETRPPDSMVAKKWGA